MELLYWISWNYTNVPNIEAKILFPEIHISSNNLKKMSTPIWITLQTTLPFLCYYNPLNRQLLCSPGYSSLSLQFKLSYFLIHLPTFFSLDFLFWLSLVLLSWKYSRAALFIYFFCISAALVLSRAASQESMRLWGVIGEISHAENMEYSRDAHSSQPASLTQALLTNLGVRLGRGALAAILGPLTLTLLPFGWVASLDTFSFLIIIVSVYLFFSGCPQFFVHSSISCPSRRPLDFSIIISVLKAALLQPSAPHYHFFTALSSVPVPCSS